MDSSFFAYLQQLELMAFFSGYPLVYAIVLAFTGSRPPQNSFKSRVFFLLPFAYALTGTLYLGMQVRNLYPDYSFDRISQAIFLPWLVIWGLLSILFWIPLLRKKPVLSLLHSLVFFFFLVKDLVMHSFGSSVDKDIVKNDMKTYTDSILLNVGTLIVVVIISSVTLYFQRKKGSGLTS